MYYRSRCARPPTLFGAIGGLFMILVLAHALIAAAITLGTILGVAAGVALAFPSVRAMIATLPKPTSKARATIARR